MPRGVRVAVPEQRSIRVFNRSEVREVGRPGPVRVKRELAHLPLHLECHGVELRLAVGAVNSNAVELWIRTPGGGPRNQACLRLVDADAVVQVVVMRPHVRQPEADVLILPLQRDIPLPYVAVLHILLIRRDALRSDGRLSQRTQERVRERKQWNATRNLILIALADLERRAAQADVAAEVFAEHSESASDHGLVVQPVRKTDARSEVGLLGMHVSVAGHDLDGLRIERADFALRSRRNDYVLGRHVVVVDQIVFIAGRPETFPAQPEIQGETVVDLERVRDEQAQLLVPHCAVRERIQPGAVEWNAQQEIGVRLAGERSVEAEVAVGIGRDAAGEAVLRFPFTAELQDVTTLGPGHRVRIAPVEILLDYAA